VFYTYAHYTPEGRLFYIGKGNGRRAHSHRGRNIYWRRVVEKHGNPDVQILANWKTEAEAFDHEILLIKCFKDLGHKLTNLSDGGEGPSGMKHTEARKKQVSEFFKGSAFNTGNINARKYKWIGTHINSGELIAFDGSNALVEAGFQHANVIKCINGTRQSHKGYIWRRELLETKQCH
jgi:hypothetical protein